MNEEKKDEYFVPFKGCRPLNKRQANIVGFTLICGFLATPIVVPTLSKGILSGSLVLGVTIVGYFLGKNLFGS
jgi:uncharacterized membrane protein